MGRRRKPIFLENLTVNGIADKGRGLLRGEDGRVIFVENAIPGDVVDVRVTKKKKDYLIATPTRLVTPSPDRTEAFCQHYGVCGGCKWQHVQYDKQLAYKHEVVETALRRIGKVSADVFLPPLAAPTTRRYRNKLEFSFCNKRWLQPEELNNPDVSAYEDVLGFHRAGAFDKIVNITECHLMEEPVNPIRNRMREIAHAQELDFYDVRQNTGYLRNVVMRRTSLGQWMLIVVVNEDVPERLRTYLDAILAEFPTITSLYYCINTKVNDFILDLPIERYHGTERIEERLGDVRFTIGPKSFFQTNTGQAKNLYDEVLRFAALSGTENVYDLYTGIGSIALYAAQAAGHVVGVEEIPAAIEDARANQALNGIDNCTFYAGDVKDILTTEFAERHGKPDLVITDPPRAGMHERVVRMLLELAAPRIVYVSCNPATQARDIGILSEAYDVKQIRTVDMFPHTYHVESIALLELREAR